jgi:hypothetical protein
MTRLVLDAKRPVKRIEVMDWLQSQGLTTYDVTPLPAGAMEDGSSSKFGFTTDDSSARRALSSLTGRTIGRTVITIRLDKAD